MSPPDTRTLAPRHADAGVPRRLLASSTGASPTGALAGCGPDIRGYPSGADTGKGLYPRAGSRAGKERGRGYADRKVNASPALTRPVAIPSGGTEVTAAEPRQARELHEIFRIAIRDQDS
jgi:hypothetical protein